VSDRWTAEQLAAGWRWVLAFEYAGATYYMGTESWDLRVGSQTVAVVAGMLDAPDVEEAIDLWVTDAPRSSVAVALMMPVHVGQLVSRGYMLDGVRGELAQVYVGGSWEERRTVLVGTFTDPEYGGEDEPVTVSLEENVLDDTGTFPDELVTFQRTEWDAAGVVKPVAFPTPDESNGRVFPFVVGTPGAGITAGSPTFLLYSYATVGPVLHAVWALAGHQVDASSVTLRDEDGNTQVATVEHVFINGRMVAVAEHVIGGSFLATGQNVAVVWDNGAGLPGIERAGALLAYALERSQARVDYQSLLTARVLLDDYRIDTYIDQTVTLAEWLLQSVLEVLPVSMVSGPRGVYPQVWAWTATAADAMWSIDTSVETDVTRLSRVSYEGRADVANAGTFRYRVNPLTDEYATAIRYSGNPVDVAGLWTDDVLRRSYGQFGRVVLDYESGVISDDATAARVVAWRSRRYALPTRTVEYAMPPRYGSIRRGDVLSITDADVGFSDDVALVQSIRWTEDHGLVVSLRVTSHA
jgi:hypothetical protein